jgi:hypothetical protein
MKYQTPSSLRNSTLLKSSLQLRSIRHPELCLPNSPQVLVEFPGYIAIECVALFFRWHYPQCLFVDRDQFLLGFLNHSYASSYVTRALEHSICALGALLSADKTIRDLADNFSKSAIQCLEWGNMLDPQDLSIQALILCSFFQIGKGDFSKAWMLSGMLSL